MTASDKQGSLYTPDERSQMAELYEKGLSQKEIAAQFGCCTGTVLKALRAHGIKVRRMTLSPEQKRQMVDLYESGMTQEEVALQTGCSTHSVIKVLREFGIKTRRVIFSAEDRCRMIDFSKSGLSQDAIASQFNCSVTTVQRALGRFSRARGGSDGRQKYSPEDLRRIADLYASGLSLEEVATQVGCSRPTVRKACRKHGVKTRDTTISPKERRRMIKLYQRGLTQKEVAAKVGRYHVAVGKVLREEGVPKRRSGRECHFSDYESQRMAELFQEGWSTSEIAEKFHCSRRLVELALHNLGISTEQAPAKLVRRGSYTPQERQQMADLYQSGLSLKEVAAQISCNIETVVTSLQTLGIARRQNEDRSKFSPEDRQRMADIRKSGASLSDIAAQFHCHTSYVRKILRDLGVKVRREKYSSAMRRRMAELYQSGLSRKDVAAKLSCSPAAVTQALREFGVIVRQRGPSLKDRQRMAKLYESGMTQQEIAKKFGSSSAMVQKVLRESGVAKRPSTRVLSQRSATKDRTL